MYAGQGQGCRARIFLATVSLMLAGCSGTTGGPFEKLFPKPVRIGTTVVNVNPFLPPPQFITLRTALANEVFDQPVQFVSELPSQIKAHLASGWLQFAVVPTAVYADLADQPEATLLAVPVNPLGKPTRQGLIVVAAKSDIQTVAELKGKRFAFGPSGSLLRDKAAVAALQEHGIEPANLARELLPIPGGRLHAPSSLDAARLVVYDDGVPAGVVDEVDWAGWPKTGGNLLKPAQDQLRVIARTQSVPEGPVLASAKTDPALVTAMSEFLRNQVGENRRICQEMGITGLREADKSLYDPIFKLLAPAAPREPAQQP